MKIITRYFLSEFIKPFLLALLGFTVIILITKVLEELNFIISNHPGFWLTFKYLASQVPGLIQLIIPLAVLFAVLMALGGLAKTSELTAMRAGGANIFQAAVPLFFAGLVICFLSLLFSEIVVPKANQIRRHTQDVEIEHHAESSSAAFHQNLSLRGDGNALYHIGTFDGSKNTMSDVVILQFDNNSHMKSRIDAHNAHYEDGRWVFENGYQRTFNGNDDEVQAIPFDRTVIDLPEKPSDFTKEHKDLLELSIAELILYIRQLERNGSDYHKELVELHNKLAFPFGCVILALLGVPWGWSMGKYSGIVSSFGICLLVGLAYIGGMQIGHTLGEGGTVPPFFAIWSINLVFAVMGPVLILRKNR
jgi:lipopolysaccharide export system permease protein